MKNLEIERKFLVNDMSYQALAIRKYEIVQAYLCKDPTKTIRVRIRDNQAFLTIKSSVNQVGFARFEWEREIDIKDAKQLLQLALPGMIEKTRWIIPATSPVPTNEPLFWEVDEFHGRLFGLTLAELELPSQEQPYDTPSFIGEEVTGNPRYYNANM